MIKGDKTLLVPAGLSDKKTIYDWCYNSEITKSHSGLPHYPENPIATWDEFFGEGYVDYFFTGTRPEDGRGFIILNDGEQAGFISYCSFHLNPGKSELDIWMNCEANCGKGFGSDAIISLGSYLNKNQGIAELIMRPSKKNARAAKAYMKAGFKKSEKPASYYLLDEYMPLYGAGDYGEGGDLLLVKQF